MCVFGTQEVVPLIGVDLKSVISLVVLLVSYHEIKIDVVILHRLREDGAVLEVDII